MIALTQEKREELVSRLKIYIRTTETAVKARLATEEDLFNLEVRKIALASLAAVPFGWEIAGNIFPTLEEALKPGYIGTPEPIYDEPPVQGVKLPPEFNESHDSFNEFRRGWNGAISEVKRINGLGE